MTHEEVLDEAQRRFDAYVQRTGVPREHAATLYEARTLVRTALNCLDRGGNEIDRACWRLADALGLIATLRPDVLGIAGFTGRGNKLSRAADAQTR